MPIPNEWLTPGPMREIGMPAPSFIPPELQRQTMPVFPGGGGLDVAGLAGALAPMVAGANQPPPGMQPANIQGGAGQVGEMSAYDPALAALPPGYEQMPVFPTGAPMSPMPVAPIAGAPPPTDFVSRGLIAGGVKPSETVTPKPRARGGSAATTSEAVDGPRTMRMPQPQAPTNPLAKLFGGNQPGLLSPEQQKAAGLRGLQQAGLGIIQASAPTPYGTPNATGAQIMGAGIQAGQQAYEGEAGQMQKQAWTQNLQEMMGGQGGMQAMTGGQWDQVIMGAMQNAPEMLPYLTELRKSMGTQAQGKWIDLGDRMALVDAQGNILQGHKKRTGGGRAPQIAVNPDTGMAEYAVYTPRDGDTPGSWEFTGVNAPRSDRMQEKQASASAFLIFNNEKLDWMAQQSAPKLVSQKWLRDNMGEGGFIAQAAWATVPVEDKRMFGTAVRFAEGWLRITTGAAYNETEYFNALLQFVPLAGDEPEVVADKTENRNALMRMLGVIASGKPLSYEEIQEYTRGTTMKPLGAGRYGQDGAGSEGWVAPDVPGEETEERTREQILADANALIAQMDAEEAAAAGRI